MVHGVENELDAGGNAELLEDVKQIFLDGVMAEIEFAGDGAIAESLGDEGRLALRAG